MPKTNLELVKHCEMALKEKWFYLWGSYAQLATQAVIDANIRQYPVNEKWRSYVTKAIGNNRVCDCYGLIKSFLWWVDGKSSPKYNAAQDVGTAGAWGKAKETGILATLPEIPGVILYMDGHVGVYMGNGRFVECRGGGCGMAEGSVKNGKIVSGSKFTHWFKDVNIDYIPAPQKTEKEDDEMIDTTKIKIDDKIYTVNRIFKGDKNYVELQSLTQAGIRVEYDAENKMPVLYTK